MGQVFRDFQEQILVIIKLCFQKMIKAILIFNNHGKPRLNKFYHYYNESQQQQIIKETFQLVSKRDDNVCNFLEGGSLIGILMNGSDDDDDFSRRI